MLDRNRLLTQVTPLKVSEQLNLTPYKHELQNRTQTDAHGRVPTRTTL